ncbi:hypothetical protein BC739_008100 [Kutzneria viridogrisea]|uniref:Uncharacterized protein n=2 Tax=Kutzneria TaxID=43356 RepID=W5W7X3_9PSEU|nr:hypothetical protein [Kutzneria albida]AHH97233.1 hypothetical protein KALB_3869 [Kutzneria albida DSM 43870]MBA8930853.1 hypothetical protein [Kutzneria viridogrisea]
MIRTFIRVIVLLGVVGAVGLYVWLGLHTPDSEFSTPWDDYVWLPVLAGCVGAPILLISIMAGPDLNSRAFREAPIGVGTITEVRQTGLYINDEPQLALTMTVRTEDGQSFQSVAKQVVPMTDLALVAPGVVLPVRYLPGRTDRVEINKGGDPAAVQAVYDRVMIRAGLSSERAVAIAARGTKSSAVVSAVRATGRIVEGNGELSLTLLVKRPDGSTFEATSEKVIPGNLLGFVQPGRVLTVFYLPASEQEVVLHLPANP